MISLFGTIFSKLVDFRLEKLMENTLPQVFFIYFSKFGLMKHLKLFIRTSVNSQFYRESLEAY